MQGNFLENLEVFEFLKNKLFNQKFGNSGSEVEWNADNFGIPLKVVLLSGNSGRKVKWNGNSR